MNLLSCRKISSGFYMLDNVAYECYTPTWYTYSNGLLVPLLIFFVIVFPLWMMYGINAAYRKKELKTVDYRYKYGFLCQDYSYK